MNPTRFIDLDGVAIAYEVQGDVDRPPLVFVHGYAMRASGPAYRELIAALARRFAVHAIDLRGHGASANATGNWSLPRVADDVAALVDRLDLRDCVYVGHSIGGFTGLLAALRHPGIFSALCLLAPAAASGGRHTPQEVAQLFAEHGRDRDVMRGALTPMYHRPLPDEVEYAVDAAAMVDRRVHEAFFPHFAALSIEDRLGEIDVPVMLLRGALDNVVPAAEQHATATRLPLCKEVVFSTEGHMLPLEAAAMTAREILAFCDHDAGALRGAGRRAAR